MSDSKPQCRYVKYQLTGVDARNGCKSEIPVDIIWANNILTLKERGLKHILSVGYSHIEEYFEIGAARYTDNLDSLLMYGDVEEVTQEQIDCIKQTKKPAASS